MVDFRVTDNIPEESAHRAAGLAANGLYMVAGAYCMRELTDGWVPLHYVTSWPQGKRAAGVLVERGLWREEARDGLPGYRFTDWSAQRSAESVRQARAKAATRMANKRAERKVPVDNSPRRKGFVTTVSENEQREERGSSLSTAPPCQPDKPPTSSDEEMFARTSSERSDEVREKFGFSLSRRDIGGTSSGGRYVSERARSRTAPRPPRCALHEPLPADADVPPCRPCRDARLAAEAAAAAQANEAEAARIAELAAIRRCRDCDGEGQRLGPDRVLLTPYVRCDHQPLAAVIDLRQRGTG